MTMPTSIFNYLPSNLPGTIASSVARSIPGLPAGPTASIVSGLAGGLASQLGIPGLGGLLPTGGASSAGSVGTDSQLKEFLTNMQTEGVAWNSRFFALLTPPASIKALVGENGATRDVADAHQLMLRTDMAELPGITYSTSEVRYGGPSFKAPNIPIYSDLTLNFILSADMTERYFFDFWAATIKDPSDLWSYFDDIVSTIEVTAYAAHEEGLRIYGVKFLDVWPISVSPIQLSWQDTEIMRLSVTFAYTRWDPVVYPALTYPEASQFFSQGIGASGSFLKDFAFGLLPSIPGGAKVLGIAGMTSSQLIGSGVSLLGNSIKTKDPISRAVIGAGTSTINKFLGGR
jgi:hypothetical protein